MPSTNTNIPVALAPVIAALCKGVIEEAHRGGSAGCAEGVAFIPFSVAGASLAQFEAFVGQMQRAGLIERRGECRLHATPKGLAYVGIAIPKPAVPEIRLAA